MNSHLVEMVEEITHFKNSYFFTWLTRTMFVALFIKREENLFREIGALFVLKEWSLSCPGQ
jgi:hypothetical protein